MENVPGGDLEELARLRYDDDPKKFRMTVLAKLEQHHPSVYDRIDQARFDLQQPHDLLQGGVVPTVRRTSVDLGDGKLAIAVGDVHSVVDPVIGQGANIASYSAWVLGEEIVKATQFDSLFCERVDRRREERVLGAQRWTNFMLVPPSPEFFGLVGAMSAEQGAVSTNSPRTSTTPNGNGRGSRRRRASTAGSPRRRRAPARRACPARPR